MGIATQRVAGSFRDPSGYVFRDGERVLRAIDGACHDVLGGLRDSGRLAKLVERGRIVETTWLEGEAHARLTGTHAPFAHFLEHAPIAPWTYPYEWSISMLADAGRATLDLQEALVGDGCSLKDATAYNVQFAPNGPVFIDVASIERPRRVDLWVAMGQFNAMFTFPLLLSVHYGWDLRSCFIPNLGGMPLERVAEIIGRSGRSRPRAWLDITIPNWLGRRQVGKQLDTNEVLARKRSGDSRALVVNLKRLARKLEKLAASYRPEGVWADYERDCTYDDTSEGRKREIVAQAIEEFAPATVLDLGCNTGTYSVLAAKAGARVIAIDGDHDAIEILYRRIRAGEAPKSITPMVVDLTNPSPAIGFRNEERPSFHERIQADCVLALALVHHLLVTGNLSPEAISDLFASLTRAHLIVEFVPMQDPMFKELLKHRVGPLAEITLETFVDVLSRRFDVVRQAPVEGSQRVLLVLRKKGA